MNGIKTLKKEPLLGCNGNEIWNRTYKGKGTDFCKK